MADCNGDVLEHRHVMSQVVGRMLTSKEHVHHINGDRTDNRIENLELLGHSEHAHLHSSRQKPYPPCACGRRHYARGMCINCYMRWFKARKKHRATS
jgi:hypothetical protein